VACVCEHGNEVIFVQRIPVVFIITQNLEKQPRHSEEPSYQPRTPDSDHHEQQKPMDAGQQYEPTCTHHPIENCKNREPTHAPYLQ
jgi:hypothetical protein